MKPDKFDPVPLSVVFLFALLVLALAPSNGWLDSSALATSSLFMGVAHPPGEPLYSMVGRLFTFIPLGNVAYRTNILSAVFLVMSLTVFLKLARLLLNKKTALFDTALIFTGLYFFLAFSFMVQGVRTEVYSLNLFLSLLIVHFFVSRRYCASFFVFGLSLGCHPLLTIIILPAFLVDFVLKKRDPQILLYGLFFALIGASVYLYLPLRASSEPIYNFGNPQDMKSFLWVVSGELYKAYSGFSPSKILSNMYDVFNLYADQTSVMVIILSMAGLIMMLFRRTAVGLMLIILFFADFSTILVNMHFDPLNKDAHGYLMLSFAVLAVGFIYSIVFMEEKLLSFIKFWARPLALIAVVIALLILVLQTLRFQGMYSKARDYSASDFTRLSIKGLPYGSLVFTGSFTTFSLLSYGVLAENLRSDLALLYSGFMENDGYYANVKRNYPKILQDPQGFRFDTETIETLAGKRPVFVELAIKERSGGFGLRFEPKILDSLCPYGWFHRFCASYAGMEPPYFELWRELFKLYPVSDFEFRRHVMLGMFLHSKYFIRRSDKESARWLVDEGLRLNKDFEPFYGLGDQIND